MSRGELLCQPALGSQTWHQQLVDAYLEGLADKLWLETKRGWL